MKMPDFELKITHNRGLFSLKIDEFEAESIQSEYLQESWDNLYELVTEIRQTLSLYEHRLYEAKTDV